jgi:hypothetical protein
MEAKINFRLAFCYFLFWAFWRLIGRLIPCLHRSLCLTSHRILNYWLHQKFLFAMLYLTEFVVLIWCILEYHKFFFKKLTHLSSHCYMRTNPFHKKSTYRVACANNIKFGAKYTWISSKLDDIHVCINHFYLATMQFCCHHILDLVGRRNMFKLKIYMLIGG